MTVRFPDQQRLIVVALEVLTGAGRTGIKTPAGMDTDLPFVRARRIGGHSDWVTDTATIAVDVFDDLYDDTLTLAEQIREWLVGPPPPIPVLDRVTCTSAPIEMPWASASPVRRVGAIYQVDARRTTT